MRNSALCITCGLLLMLSAPRTSGKENGAQGLGKVGHATGAPARTQFNINTISTTLWDDGMMDFDGTTKAAFVYPAGSGKTAIYSSNLVWAAMYGDTAVRAGGGMYWSGMQPGKILPGFIPQDVNDPSVRIYRVRSDIPPGKTNVDISAEVRDGEGSESSILNQYWKDWNEWPWQDGAPFEDRNHNGTYEPAEDIPGVPDADQTIWFVANDLSAANMIQLFGSSPMGIEMHVTVWGYARSGALGHTQFRRYLLINKSSAVFDSMYVSQWVDPDLGATFDDYVGCDTSRSLGYLYNAKEIDALYAPLPPPVVGFDFLQGPVVDGSPSDEAIFKGNKVKGMRNLPMTAFYYFTYGTSSFGDPPYWSGRNEATLQIYNFLQGRVGKTGDPFLDNNGIATPFVLAGDPVTRTGWIDGMILPPGDRRLGTSTGPFRMAPGDTQEIVVGVIAAGAESGVDRLTAITLMRYYDDQVQAAYDRFFQVQGPPPSPRVQVSEFDQETVLRWDQDTAAVSATENSNDQGYAFQGYNIYQFPAQTPSMSEARRLATYDVVDGVRKVWDRVFDAPTGSVIQIPVQFGDDTGIKRFYTATHDVFTGRPLLNDSKYYFGITAYSYNPDPNIIPSVVETPVTFVTVIPQRPGPGTRYGALPGDTIHQVVQSPAPGIPLSDGSVQTVIVDPRSLTGHTYAVRFDTLQQTVQWTLRDVTAGLVKLDNQTDQSGEPSKWLIDGLQLKVTDSPHGMQGYTIPTGGRRFTWSGANWGMEGFNGAMGIACYGWLGPTTQAPYQARSVLLVLAATDSNGRFNPADTTVSYGYRYMRSSLAAPARPEFAPFVTRPGAGYAFQAFEKNIPLAAYDVDASPPRRLALGFLENNVAGGLVNGLYWPGSYEWYTDDYNNTSTNGPREWLFIFNAPYRETPNPALQVNILGAPTPMMWLSTATRRGNVAFQAGDQLLITAYHPNGPGHVFEFTAPGNVIGNTDLAKTDVSMVNVFPNPYYGANPQETNRYYRFVTFTHLPQKATIRIFNLAGVMVRKLTKDDATQFLKWDLQNDSGYPVGSGLYLAHVEMPDLAKTKVLKIAVVQEQQVLD